jgi:hypothetical protein
LAIFARICEFQRLHVWHRSGRAFRAGEANETEAHQLR